MTRLPLQTGGGATVAWMTSLSGLPALLLVAWGASLVVLDYGGPGLALAAIGGALLLVAIASVPTALRRRASDIVVDDAGFVIDGGPFSGLRIDWAHLGEGSVEALTRSGGVTELVLKTPGAAERVLAHTADAEEAASVRNLASALRAARHPEAAAAPELPPQAPCCPSCGAPVAPSSEPTTRCGFCGHTSATQPDVIERMRGHAEHERAASHARAAVSELLAQPSATVANLRMLVVGALAAWIVIAFIAGEIFLATIGIAEAFTLGVSAVFSLLLVGLVTVMTTRRFADRHALQSLLAVFGARPPRRTGEPWSCRGCGGPLPSVDARLATCVFCARQNVIGADMRPSAQALGEEVERLDGVLERRGKKALRAMLWFWLLAPAVALCGFVALFFLALGLEHLEEEQRCADGEARACVSLAFSFSDEANLGRDLPRAARLAERGCLRGSDDGCCLARAAKEEGWGPFVEPAALERRLTKLAAKLEAALLVTPPHPR